MRRTMEGVAALLVLCTGTPALAQDLSAGLEAGPSFGLGTFGEGRVLETGWNVELSVPLAFQTSRFGAEFDVGYAQHPYSWTGGNGSVGIWTANLSGVVRLRERWTRVRPYVAAGLGAYYVEVPERNTVAPAASLGLGARFGTGNLRGFVEVRYHYVLTWDRDLQFLPVTLGVRYALKL